MSRSEDDTSTDRSADPVETAPEAAPETAPETAPEAAPEPAPEPATRIETPWVPAGQPAKAAKPAKPPRAKAAKQPKAPREPRASRERPQLPPIDGHVAAGVTGLLVGGWLVLSTFATLHLCESLRSSSSCGGPGLLLLVAIVIVGVVLGAVLLRLFKVHSAGSMSFLAVALVAVLVMIFFAGSLDRWWTIPIVAVLTVASYLLSHWVTTTYIDPAE